MGTYENTNLIKKSIFVCLFLMFLGKQSFSIAESIIIEHNCTKIDRVPLYWIYKAKADFRIAYGHTSHGSQIVSGMGVLMAQSSLYAYNHDGTSGALSLHDGVPSGDLGNPDRTTWAQRTRDLLTTPGCDRNMIMWSWCGQADTTATNIDLYLALMNQLELDYPNVVFVYMTGHLNGTGEVGNLHQRNNQIRDFCQTYNKVLFDFADIESYDPDGNYFRDKYADDQCNYDSDGNGSLDANWAVEWCSAHPGECSSCSCAHSESLNCDLKGRAFWWMMARLAGWGGYRAKSDLLGTWPGQGVYFRNSENGSWSYLTSPANQISTGDLDADGIDDLIGTWPGQQNVWVKFTTIDNWISLASEAQWISTGDMNGDRLIDLLGTWSGQGVYYRSAPYGDWVKMASPADKITAGDLNGDGTDDLIGIWPSQGGVWVKYSDTSLWSLLSSTANWIGCGDMNGDGRDDFLGTWTGQGVYYRNSLTGVWVQMALPATQIVAGDIDGDGTDDLIGIWPSQGGVWVKYSSSGTWQYLSSAADMIACGKMIGAGANTSGMELSPMGALADGPEFLYKNIDSSPAGPEGENFIFLEEKNLIPQLGNFANILSTPGPGESGFKYIVQKNLVPQERMKNTTKKRK